MVYYLVALSILLNEIILVEHRAFFSIDYAGESSSIDRANNGWRGKSNRGSDDIYQRDYARNCSGWEWKFPDSSGGGRLQFRNKCSGLWETIDWMGDYRKGSFFIRSFEADKVYVERSKGNRKRGRSSLLHYAECHSQSSLSPTESEGIFFWSL